MRKIVWAALVGGTVLAGFVAAGETLTLEQAVRTALERNPEILAAQQELTAAMGRRMQKAAVSDPRLVFSDEGIAFSRAKSGSMEKEYSLGLEQDLEFPGKRALREEAGRYAETLAALALDRARVRLAANVKNAYYRAVLSRRTIESLDQTSSMLGRLIDNLVVKYQAGDAAYTDILRAKIEKARVENQILEERRAGIAYRTDLESLLGNSSGDEAVLSTDIAYVPFEQDLAAVRESRRASSPTLKMLAARLRQGETEVRLAGKAGLPDFSLGLYAPSLRAGAWGFSIGVTLPVWRGRRQGQVMEAEAAASQARIALESGERRFMLRIDNAYAGLKAADAQVKLFEQKLLKDMGDEIRLALEQYQYGRIEFFNLLDLARTFAAAQLEHLKALYQYLAALADLEAAGEAYAE